MEAHQKLDTPIELVCCSRIGIVVRNADRRQGEIALELWVRNRRSRETDARYYLGTAVIPSSTHWVATRNDGEAGLPEEMLECPVPRAMEGLSFDEMAVVVKTAPGMGRMGAQIGIKRFVLEP
jgi:hypothetical protein